MCNALPSTPSPEINGESWLLGEQKVVSATWDDPRSEGRVGAGSLLSPSLGLGLL